MQLMQPIGYCQAIQVFKLVNRHGALQESVRAAFECVTGEPMGMLEISD